METTVTHPPANCGPLLLPLPPGVACPTCGVTPVRFLPAADLRPGVRVAAGFLPLMKAAEVLFAYRYTLHDVARVSTVYLYDGDGQPQPDDHLASALIPVTDTRRADLAQLARNHPIACTGCAYEDLAAQIRAAGRS